MVSVWKFVDRPEVGATTLLDMNNGTTWRMLREALDLSPPPLRRSVVQNAMTDGGIVTSASYDLRELRFQLVLSGVDEDARAAQLKALEAELSKPSNLLMFKAETASFPVFFRTFRSDNFSWDREFIPNAWLVECSVMAEPFAIGTRHDVAAGVVVTNNPASGTNSLFFDITGIRGDSPALAFARVGTGLGAGATFVLSQRTANNPTAVTNWAQCEAGTLGTDTTTGGHDPGMSGGGVNPYANPDFEINNSGWTVNNCTLTRDTAQFRSGVASGRLNSNAAVATGTRFVNSIPITDVAQGVSYTASAWVRSGTTFTTGQVQIGWLDAAGAFMTVSAGSTVTLSTTWQQATCTATPPVGAAKADVRVIFGPDPGTTAASAYFDDVARTPGSNFVRTTFATNTLITRATVTVPTATSSEALKGRYRVFVKVRRSAATSAFTMRYHVPGGSDVFGPQVSYDVGLPNSVWMMDLGIVEFPSPGPAPAGIGYSGLTAGHSQPTLEIQAKRDSGALPLDMDYVVLMPADERMCSFRQVSSMGYIVLDGPQDMTYGMAAGTSPFGAAVSDRIVDNNGGLVPRIGGLPMLVPGAVNRWHVLRATHDVTATSTWDVSYWPRWREVATS